MTCYGSAIEILPKTPSSEIVRSLTKAVWGRNFQMRALEMVRSMICTPTGTHPYWASIVRCFTDVARCAEKRPAIADTLKRIKTKKWEKPHLKSGPIANMEKAAKAMGYTLSDAITIANGNETIPIIGQQIRWLKSKLVTITKDLEIQNLRKRTAEVNIGKTNHRKDFQGILEDGIDHDSTSALIKLKVKKPKNKRDNETTSNAAQASPPSDQPGVGSQEGQRNGHSPDHDMAGNEDEQSDEDPFGHGGGMDCDSDTTITHNVTHKDPP
jgi:hypothetical protein